jgi:hypothetical protein
MSKSPAVILFISSSMTHKERHLRDTEIAGTSSFDAFYLGVESKDTKYFL